MAPNRELLARNGIAIRTNRFGMRDNEPAEQKSNSPCRIAVIGDSYTLGLGVREEETYAKVLENVLRESRAAAQCPFEVLNFGVVGYSSSDESLVLKYRVVDFDPHVVVIGYVLNDPEIDPTAQTLHRYYAPHPWWRRFRVFRLPGEAKTNWDVDHLGGGDYYKYLHAPGEPNWQSVVDAFADIRQVAAQHHIKVLLVIFPELTVRFKGKPWSEYPYGAIHRQVAELAEKNGFDVLDLLTAFSEPRRLDCHTLERAPQLVDNQRRQGFTLNILRNNQQGRTRLRTLFEQRQQLLQVTQLLLVQENVGIVQDGFHALGIGDEVWREIATIELHPLNDFEGRLGGVAFFNRDDAIFPHLLHGLRNKVADQRIVVGGAATDLGDLLLIFHVTAECP